MKVWKYVTHEVFLNSTLGCNCI